MFGAERTRSLVGIVFMIMPFIPYEIAAERKAVMTGFALRRIIDGVAYTLRRPL